MAILLEDLRINTKKFLLADKFIKITGPDSEQYLNSQTTNNVKTLKDDNFQFNSILDTSGKIISSFVLYKKSNDTFIIIVDEDYTESTIERIERYHIAEEFEVSTESSKTVLVINNPESCSESTYFFYGDQICFNYHDNDLTSGKEFKQLSLLTGVPSLGVEAKQGELINNTFFDELSVDYSKGCYPGQETVSKINTRRGAAFKPVVLVIESEIEHNSSKIYSSNRKIGDIKNSIKLDGKTYFYTSLLREFRVDNLDLIISIDEKEIKAKVNYLPIIKPDKRSLAIALYDTAMDFFLKEDNENAVKYFIKTIETDNKFEDAFESLGVLYGRLEKFDKAIGLMEKLHELNPKCMMAYTNLSLYHMKIGDIETAEKYKADATLLNFELLGDEADKKRKQKELDEKRVQDIARREGMFKQVLEMDPQDAMANNGMGEIELDRNNYLQAEKYFREAISGDSKYSVAYLGLSKTLYNQEKKKELVKVLKLGISIASKNGDLMPANEMQALLTKIS